MMGSFATAFSILGTFLLFVSSRPVTIGSVFMCAAVSSAVANVFGDFDVLAESQRALLSACGDGTVDQTATEAVRTCVMRIGAPLIFRNYEVNE